MPLTFVTRPTPLSTLGCGGGFTSPVKGFTSGSASSIVLPTNTTGDMLVLFVMGTGGSVTTPSGWTQQQLLTTNDVLACYTAPNTGSVIPTPTFPSLTGFPTFFCLSIVGASGVDASGNVPFSGPPSTLRTAPSLTSAGTNRMLIVCAGLSYQFATPYTFSAPMINLGNANQNDGSNGVSLGVFYQSINVAGSTGTRSISAANGLYDFYGLTNLLVF